MRPILSLYVLRQHIGPFIFGILVITFLFVMDLLIDYIDLFLGKGVPLRVVLEVFFLSLGWVVALTVPMGTLVAAVTAFGRLSADNEITAMKAGGVSIYQIIAAPLLASAILAYGLVEFNNRVLPESNHRLASLLVDIHKMRPALAIKEGMFTDVQGYTIRVEKLNARTSEIEGVTIQKNKESEETETIVARRGKLRFSNDGNVLTLFLEDGEIHGIDENRPSRYHRISFDTHTVRIAGIGSELVRSEKKTRGDRELSASDMIDRVRGYREEVRRIRADENSSIRDHVGELFSVLQWVGPSGPERERMVDALSRRNYNQKIRMLATKIGSQTTRIRDREKQIDRYMVEVHKKYALPVACVVFVLVGTPLGVRAQRGGIGVGVGFSILFFVVYYLFLMGGEKLADRGFVPPAVAMWAANVLIGALGIFLVVRSTRESGFFRLPRLRFAKRGRS